jgi:hypothetical protein
MTRAGRARRRTLGRRDAQTAALGRCQEPGARLQDTDTTLWKIRIVAAPARHSWLLVPGSSTLNSRKEVIQPQVPLRLPCYDFTPVADLTVVGCLRLPGWRTAFG